MLHDLINTIMDAEGFSETPYWDNKQWTWGYGTKFSNALTKDAEISPMYRISKSEAKKELCVNLAEAMENYMLIFESVTNRISVPRRYALIEMLYNLGLTSFLTFQNMLKELISPNQNIDWNKVALEAKDSKWYHQVGKRGERIVEVLKTGGKYEK